MTTKEEIFSTVANFIHHTFLVPLEDITPEKELEKDLGLDSLDLLELEMGVEDEFGILILDSDNFTEREVKTVQDVVDFVIAEKKVH